METTGRFREGVVVVVVVYFTNILTTNTFTWYRYINLCIKYNNMGSELMIDVFLYSFLLSYSKFLSGLQFHYKDLFDSVMMI